VTGDVHPRWAPQVVGPWAAVVGPIFERLDTLLERANANGTPAERRLIIDLVVEAEYAAWRLAQLHHAAANKAADL
jgi:hypothetical protein